LTVARRIVFVNGTTAYLAPPSLHGPTLVRIELTMNGRVTVVYVEVR
jgi:hypothetical protein